MAVHNNPLMEVDALRSHFPQAATLDEEGYTVMTQLDKKGIFIEHVYIWPNAPAYADFTESFWGFDKQHIHLICVDPADKTRRTTHVRLDFGMCTLRKHRNYFNITGKGFYLNFPNKVNNIRIKGMLDYKGRYAEIWNWCVSLNLPYPCDAPITHIVA